MVSRFSRSVAARSVFALACLGLVSAAPANPDIAVEAVIPYTSVEPLPADDTVVTAEPALEAVGSGMASYYGRELAGNRTASGERFSPGAMTAAHRTLPLGSKLLVTNLNNGKSVVVRVNDRGPMKRARIIDVSFGAAQQMQMLRSGTAMVRLELLR